MNKTTPCLLHAFACFHCGEIICKIPRHWTDGCTTALCDECGIDSVIQVPKYWATVPVLRKHLDEFLELMYNKCFEA